MSGAFWIAYERHGLLARVLAIPVLLLALIQISVERNGVLPELFSSFVLGGTLISFVFEAVYWALFALFAVPCHRVALLGPASVPTDFRLRWTKRETRFALAAFVLFVAWRFFVFVLAMLTVVVFTVTASPDHEGDAFSFLVSYVAPFVAILFVSYVWCRVSPIFPSIAVDEPLAVRSAWQMSRGNGWRLLTMLMIFPVTVQVIHTIYISYAYSHDAVPMPLLTGFLVLVILITYMLATVGVITLSLAYAELKKTGGTVDG